MRSGETGIQFVCGFLHFAWLRSEKAKVRKQQNTCTIFSVVHNRQHSRMKNDFLSNVMHAGRNAQFYAAARVLPTAAKLRGCCCPR